VATVSIQPELPPICQPIGLMLNYMTGQMCVAYCKRWRCPRCAPGIVVKWAMRLKDQRYDWFLTLTLAGDGRPTRENFAKLSHGWKNVRQYLKRNCGLEDYTWVREQGKQGSRRVHLHVALRCRRISARRLRSVATAAGLGKWLHLSRVKSSKSSTRYLTTYLGKDAGTYSWPRFVRRVQSTAPSKPKEPGWILLKKPAWQPKRTWFRDHCGGAVESVRLEPHNLNSPFQTTYPSDLSLTEREKLTHATNSDSGFEGRIAPAGLPKQGTAVLGPALDQPFLPGVRWGP
jgi:hypothetical protein